MNIRKVIRNKIEDWIGYDSTMEALIYRELREAKTVRYQREIILRDGKKLHRAFIIVNKRKFGLFFTGRDWMTIEHLGNNAEERIDKRWIDRLIQEHVEFVFRTNPNIVVVE